MVYLFCNTLSVEVLYTPGWLFFKANLFFSREYAWNNLNLRTIDPTYTCTLFSSFSLDIEVNHAELLNVAAKFSKLSVLATIPMNCFPLEYKFCGFMTMKELLLLWMFFFCNCINGSRILIIPFQGKSHMISTNALGQELKKNGHEVSVYLRWFANAV